MPTSYTSLTQPVLTSLTISVKDDDPFFNPVELTHTGFAYDGFMYNGGVQNPSQTASWYSEGPSLTRGTLASFPTDAVIVVSAGSLTILDATANPLAMWMLFYYCDQYAFPNNFQGAIESFSSVAASWGAGKLTVVMVADPGSEAMPAAILTLDFATDSVYIDYAATPS